MKPFRMSFTARALCAAATLALVGGGLVPTLGLPPTWMIPMLLTVAVGVSLVALVMGATDHPEAVFLLVILLPLGLFLYVFGLLTVLERYPNHGWVLMVLGAVPGSLFIASLGSRLEPEPTTAHTHAVAR